MKLSTKALQEFKEIYLTKFNEQLSDDRANVLGTDLLIFFKLLYQPIPKGRYEGLYQNTK